MKELAELKELIHFKGYTQRGIAKKMGMSISALQNRLNGRVAFYLDEAIVLSEILEIPPHDIVRYFVPYNI